MKSWSMVVMSFVGSLLMSSCSTVNKIGVNSSSSLLYESSSNVLAQSNYEIVKSGMAGNLLLLESLLSASPKNQNLLLTLTKGYAGYAFLVDETNMLEEGLKNLTDETPREQAIFNYSKALNFGLSSLLQHDIHYDELMKLMNEPHGIHRLLDKKLTVNKKNLELVLFSAQALGGLVNLQKDNIILISQLPIAKSMFDWVCLQNPTIEYGMCEIFYGAYEAGRPEMLGGNPAKGKEIFLSAINKHPHNWLIRTSYIQFYLIPQNDEAGFKEQMNYLESFDEIFNDYYNFNYNKDANQEWLLEEKMRLYQALALKRFKILNKYKKQLF